jgi:hypothetical protein
MDFSWIQWFQNHLALATWLTLLVAGVAAVLAYKTWRSVLYVEFSRDWFLVRASNETIQLNGNIIITRRTTRVICNGTLKINNITIHFDDKELVEHQPEGSYPVLLSAKYSGSLEGYGILRLKIKLGDGKSKKFRTPMQLLIPDKVNNSPKPPDLINIFGHRPDDRS